MSRRFYTTVEVAEAAGVPRATLQHWVKTRKISAPRIRLRRNRAVRLWTEAQKENIRRLRLDLQARAQDGAKGGTR